MNTLADAVRVTLRNVVLDKKWGAPTITNDGVSIAKEIDLEDPYERIGAELVKEVAKKTDDVAATATVLAWSMVREGLRNVAANHWVCASCHAFLSPSRTMDQAHSCSGRPIASNIIGFLSYFLD